MRSAAYPAAMTNSALTVRGSQGLFCSIETTCGHALGPSNSVLRLGLVAPALHTSASDRGHTGRQALPPTSQMGAKDCGDHRQAAEACAEPRAVCPYFIATGCCRLVKAAVHGMCRVSR
jgi:hypothetical protein